MKDRKEIINCLKESPIILKNLITHIPTEAMKEHRIKDKWSIHEHACHLTQAEQMIIRRFEEFRDTKRPDFKPYLPGKNVSADELIDMKLVDEIEKFSLLRRKLLQLIESLEETVWHKQASHPEYSDYSAYILLRHTLMHDHFHMYRIEELWLTKAEYLR